MKCVAAIAIPFLLVLVSLLHLCAAEEAFSGHKAEFGEKVMQQSNNFKLSWDASILTVRSPGLPGGEVKIWYLEAYCRPGSSDRNWHETVIGHKTELIKASGDGRSLSLRCTLKDGVTVDHVIEADSTGVDFRLTARNPTSRESEAHWAQPCIRVGVFTGTGSDVIDDKYAYMKHCFIYLDGKQAMLPTRDWATEARYTPGQVWVPEGVPREDVNPRPRHKDSPSNGLIGCISADRKWILATAWEPYQELFQGVIRCIHSDFRIGGLKVGETKTIRGKLYLVPNDISALLKQYTIDFPEHVDLAKGDK